MLAGDFIVHYKFIRSDKFGTKKPYGVIFGNPQSLCVYVWIAFGKIARELFVLFRVCSVQPPGGDDLVSSLWNIWVREH